MSWRGGNLEHQEGGWRGGSLEHIELIRVIAPATIVSEATISLTVEGLGTITSVTIGGVDVSASIANQTGGTLDVTVPDMFASNLPPGNVTIVVGDGTDTASTTSILAYPASIVDSGTAAGLPLLSGTNTTVHTEAAASQKQLVLATSEGWLAGNFGRVQLADESWFRFRVDTISSNTLTLIEDLPEIIPQGTPVQQISLNSFLNYPIEDGAGVEYPQNGDLFTLRDPNELYVADSLQSDGTAEYSDPGEIFYRVYRDDAWTEELVWDVSVAFEGANVDVEVADSIFLAYGASVVGGESLINPTSADSIFRAYPAFVQAALFSPTVRLFNPATEQWELGRIRVYDPDTEAWLIVA